MKILYIPSIQKNLDFSLNNKDIAKLPKKLFLAYTIQYKDLAHLIKQKLEKAGIQVIKIQQVLGCSKISSKFPILLIGTGDFHLLNILKQSNEVYVFNGNLRKISKKEIEKLKVKRKTALLRFYSAKNIGILVSTKPGQENINQAIKLKQNFEKQEKQAFIFLSNIIDINQFENFNIDSWINTACPGLSYDNPNIININEIKL